jgi:TRAP-type C4-dicarboxylate transport system permease small subunit
MDRAPLQRRPFPTAIFHWNLQITEPARALAEGRLMKFFQRTVFRISRYAAYLSAAILVGMVGHILLEIILRGFFNTSTYVLDEFVGYGVAAMTFLALGYALEEGSLIRVQILLTKTTGRLRQILELICIGSTLVLSCYLLFYFWRNWKRDWDRSAVSESIAEIPMWIPEGLVVIGIALFIIQLFAYFLRVASGGELITSTSEEE